MYFLITELIYFHQLEKAKNIIFGIKDDKIKFIIIKKIIIYLLKLIQKHVTSVIGEPSIGYGVPVSYNYNESFYNNKSFKKFRK